MLYSIFCMGYNAQMPMDHNFRKSEQFHEGAKRCTAHKRDGVQCMNYAAPGFNVCWKHGVGGRGSVQRRKYQFKAERLNEAFETLASDPDRLDLSEELAVARLATQQVLADLEEISTSKAPAVLMLVESVTGVASQIAKIEKDLKLSVNPEQLSAIADQFISVIAKYVTDEDVLAKIQDELDRIALPEVSERMIEHET